MTCETAELRKQALDELYATQCAACGRAKKRGQSFCRDCYYLLSRSQRRELYTRIEYGYATIYAYAKDVLKERML